jgi:hypothetical protein
MNASELWAGLHSRDMFKLAGPWREHTTQNQRVERMMIREYPVIHPCDQCPYPAILVMAYGPHNRYDFDTRSYGERKWWILSFRGPASWFGIGGNHWHETLKLAMAHADELLIERGWQFAEETK